MNDTSRAAARCLLFAERELARAKAEVQRAGTDEARAAYAAAVDELRRAEEWAKAVSTAAEVV